METFQAVIVNICYRKNENMTKTETSCQGKVWCEQIRQKNTVPADGFYLECGKMGDFGTD